MKILFISHEASRTGAPIVLLTLLKWLKQTGNHEIRIILVKGGELSDEFKQIGKMLTLEKRRGEKGTLLMYGMHEFFPGILNFIHRIKVKWFTANYSPDLVYANTILSAKMLPFIRKIKETAVLCHVHELEYIFGLFFRPQEFLSLSQYVNRYIVPAEIVKENLVDNYSVSGQIIDIVPEHIQVVPFLISKPEVLNKLQISDAPFIIMGSGTATWRKAPEIFIMIAREVARLTDLNFKFFWIGELIPAYYRYLCYEIKKMGLSAVVEFIDSGDIIHDYFTIADVFMLTSREDPFPLVCLEAASHGVPVICFDNAGGMPEFVRDDVGFCVPYLDIAAAAKKITRLMDDPALRDALGKKANKRVLEESEITVTGPRILDIIKHLVGEKATNGK